MFGGYAKTNYDAIMAQDPVEEAARRSGYNGSVLPVDLSKPADHIAPESMMIRNGDSIDLTATIAHFLWINGASGTPGNTVNDTIMEKAGDAIGLAATIWSTYRILDDAGVHIRFRASDFAEPEYARREMFRAAVEADEDGAGGVAEAVLPIGDDGVDAAFEERDTPVWDAAKRIEAYIMDGNNKTAAESVASNSRMIMHALFAVALHRKVCEGHSWFTKDNDRVDTNTHRCLGVAGSYRDEFQKFMKNHGHDIVHHLTDEALTSVCNAIANHHDEVPRTDYIVQNAIQYNGADIAGKHIHEVFQVSESATERWPAGQVGKAAVILGLKAIIGMARTIMQRVSVEGGDLVLAGVNSLLNSISKKNASKEFLTACRTALPPVIVFAAGFQKQAHGSKIDERASINAIIATNQDEYASGKGLAVAVMSCTPHHKALATAIKAQFAQIANSMNAAGAGVAGCMPIVADAVKKVQIGEDPTEASHKRMMETLVAASGKIVEPDSEDEEE